MILKPSGIIQAKLGLDQNGKVQKRFTHNCRIYMDKYVPYMDGDLRTNVLEENDRITYQSPYAHYMYEGKLYIDPETGSSWARKDTTKVATNKDLVYHTPGTGHHWDRRMVSAEIDDVIKATMRG